MVATFSGKTWKGLGVHRWLEKSWEESKKLQKSHAVGLVRKTCISPAVFLCNYFAYFLVSLAEI